MAVKNINKVIFGGQTLIDLTSDSVKADSLLQGATAHDKTGQLIQGTVDFRTLYTGSTVPDPNLGVDGDIYLRKV